jgi:MSHA biogenesis protein MshQ
MFMMVKPHFSAARWLAMGLMLLAMPWQMAWAGWSATTLGDAGFNTPTAFANLRTLNFDTVTVAAEQAAGRLTYTDVLASGGVLNLLTSSTGLDGFSGKSASVSSGNSGGVSSMTFNFPNGGTSYVAFTWGLSIKSQNSQYVTYTFSDGSTQTLYNCQSTSNANCVGSYVPSNWLISFLSALLGGNSYDSMYLTYTPASGVTITKVQVFTDNCAGCGLLGLFSLDQSTFVDNLSYVDPTIPPDHLEVTTASSSITAGTAATFTVKSCADAACTTAYTTGISGTLSLSGAGMTASYPSTAIYTIGARSSTTIITGSLTPAGTATVALTLPSKTPSGATKVYCGMGVPALAGNSCNLTVTPPLHHLQVTTTSITASSGSGLLITITACADAGCSIFYTGGVTGNLSVVGAGITTNYNTGASFTIPVGSYSTTETVTLSPTGAVTVGVSGVSPTPSNSPAVYCGFGIAASALNTCVMTVAPGINHLEITAPSSTALTCMPITYTVKACADAACSSTYTGGVIGTLGVSGGTLNFPGGNSFTIANGSATTTIQAQMTTAGTATAAISGITSLLGTALTPSNANPVFCGMGAAASSVGSCAVSVATSALSLGLSNGPAGTAQTLSISAVKSNATSTLCAPAFPVGLKTINLSCSYANPTTGTLPVQAGGVNISGGGSGLCDGTSKALSLSFDANGLSTTTLSYADVGQINLAASYVGSALTSDLGLNMSGTGTFVSMPASLGISLTSATPLKAGNAFAVKVTAFNSAGVATPNFGKETPSITDYLRLSFTKVSPTGTGAQAGTFTGTGTGGAPYISTGSLAGGLVNVSDLKWTEVGTGTLGAALVGNTYLGAATTLAGTSALLSFVPDRFNVGITQGCGGAFTYSGQPFSVVLTALNGLGNKVLNYDGTSNVASAVAKAVTLSAVNGGSLGAFSGGTIAASAFSAGVATLASAPVFTFANKLTAATSITVRATDADGASSATGTEQAVNVRSGRLKASNAFGSEKTSLVIPVQAQYWSGKAWILNSADSCTTVPATAIGRSNYLDAKGASTTAWTTTPSAVTISGGNGTLTLSAPSPLNTGSVDFSFNLGATGSTTDQSCLAGHPTTTAANLPWLRAQNGTTSGCNGVLTFDRDPSARATFGVYKPESKKSVYVRDMF